KIGRPENSGTQPTVARGGGCRTAGGSQGAKEPFRVPPSHCHRRGSLGGGLFDTDRDTRKNPPFLYHSRHHRAEAGGGGAAREPKAERVPGAHSRSRLPAFFGGISGRASRAFQSGLRTAYGLHRG